MREIIFNQDTAALLCQREITNQWSMVVDKERLYGQRRYGFNYFFLVHVDGWSSNIRWGGEVEPARRISTDQARIFFRKYATPGDYGAGHDFGLV